MLRRPNLIAILGSGGGRLQILQGKVDALTDKFITAHIIFVRDGVDKLELFGVDPDANDLIFFWLRNKF